MLKLFLLRHAEAASSFDVDDYQRPLTLYGIGQAQQVKQNLPDIDKALCSSALRTKMTLDAIEKMQGVIRQKTYSDKIYNGSPGDLMAAIQECGEEKTLLVIAHNPGIHQLANILCNDDGSENIELLKYSYNPATLSIIECDIKKWSDLKPAQNKLLDLIIPD